MLFRCVSALVIILLSIDINCWRSSSDKTDIISLSALILSLLKLKASNPSLSTQNSIELISEFHGSFQQSFLYQYSRLLGNRVVTSCGMLGQLGECCFTEIINDEQNLSLLGRYMIFSQNLSCRHLHRMFLPHLLNIANKNYYLVILFALFSPSKLPTFVCV